MNGSGFPHLRQFRIDLGMTQETFAKSIGISKTTYNNYETGAREPRSDFWEKVAKEYNVTVDFLLGLSNEKSPTSAEAEAEESSEDTQQLLANYSKLNDDGKAAARDSVEALTCLPKYKKCDSSQELA